MPRVYVPNKSFHDFSDAERFGDLVFVTRGLVNRLNINNMFRQCTEAMADAEVGDYILVSSLSSLNAVMASIMARKFGRVNLLIWNEGRYVAREMKLDNEEP